MPEEFHISLNPRPQPIRRSLAPAEPAYHYSARPHPAHLVFTPEQLPHPISRPATPTLTHARATPASHYPPGHIRPDAGSRQSNPRIPLSRTATSTPTLTHARKISHLIELPSTSSRPSRVPEKLSRTAMRRFLPFLKRESPPEFRKTSAFSILPLQNAPCPQKICLRPFCGHTLPRGIGANAAVQRRRSARPSPRSDGGHMPASFRSPRPAERNEIRSRTQRQ